METISIIEEELKEYEEYTPKQRNYLARRFYKACKNYILFNHFDLNSGLINVKVQFLLRKIRSRKTLIDDILEKKIRVKDILYKNLDDYNETLATQRDVMIQALQQECAKGSSNYRCPKKTCGKRNHTETLVMLRASDEALAIKCECLECGFIFWR